MSEASNSPEAKPDHHQWSAWPAGREPVRSLVALVIVAAVALATGAFAHGFGAATIEIVIWSVVSMVILTASLHRFFFPSRFLIDDRGLTAKYALRTQRIEWKRVRRFIHDQHGGYVSSRGTPSRFDAFRGVHILFGHSPEETMCLIKRAVEKAQTQRSASAPQPTSPDEISHEADDDISARHRTGEAP